MSDSAIGVTPNTELTSLEELEKSVNDFLENKNSGVVIVFPDGGYIELVKGCKFIGITNTEESKE